MTYVLSLRRDTLIDLDKSDVLFYGLLEISRDRCVDCRSIVGNATMGEARWIGKDVRMVHLTSDPAQTFNVKVHKLADGLEKTRVASRHREIDERGQDTIELLAKSRGVQSR